MTGPLGRRTPPNLDHVARYPLRELIEDEGHALAIPPPGTEKGLGLPWWWRTHDQGREGACVGFGCSAMVAITNHRQRLLTTGRDITYRYDARWLYREAQLVDEWDDTPPGEGTSVRAGCEILHTRGHRRQQGGNTNLENPAHGIAAYRWAQNSDEVRAAIFADLAVSIGINWYGSFDKPFRENGEYWISIAPGSEVRGGHCVCLYRMSDRRGAFRLMNSWGPEYPPVWLPYSDLDRLIGEWGEVAVVVDR